VLGKTAAKCPLGATSAIEVLILATAAYAILQTIAFSLYLAEALSNAPPRRRDRLRQRLAPPSM
jgi:hypothetical protein